MEQYLNLLERILEHGEKRGDRTGVGTYSLFGEELEFDLQDGFPAVTTKKLMFKSVAVELLWFLRGDTNLQFLHEHDVHIWDDNAFQAYLEHHNQADEYEKGSDRWNEARDDYVNRVQTDEQFAEEEGVLGPVYGKQWREWENSDGERIDQIDRVIENIQSNPLSRRHIVSAWNAGEIHKMALAPCHAAVQFYVRDGTYLDAQMYQRSADMLLGVPFNIASYSLLTHMAAQVTGYEPGVFYHRFGDAHIYQNHVEQVQTQLSRTPYDRPSLHLNPAVDDIDDFGWDDIELRGYEHDPPIRAPMAV